MLRLLSDILTASSKIRILNSRPSPYALYISHNCFHTSGNPKGEQVFSGTQLQVKPLSRLIVCHEFSSSSDLSIWRRRKEIGKEGLIVTKELKRLCKNPVLLDRFMCYDVSRLLKSDLLSVLAELQRQDHVFLCMKLYDVVRKEIWYKPDRFLYRDMLLMLARNKKVEEANRIWNDLRKEEVLLDQHTYGDIIRVYLDKGLPEQAMEVYEEMRSSPDPPRVLPFRVILRGLDPYPELMEQLKEDFLELFPGMILNDPSEDTSVDEKCRVSSEDDEDYSNSA